MVNKPGTVLLLAALLAPCGAWADDGLRCGLSLGATQLTLRSDQKSEKEEKESKALRNFLPGPQVAKLAHTATTSNEKLYRTRSRLPAAITVAIIGCTWH